MKTIFDRVCMRTLVTIFMFVGVALFLLPYFSESLSTGIIFLILGATIAVSCGFLRCYLDGDCAEDRRARKLSSLKHSPK
jgi:predicted MFS family arabinose efflux permease